MDSAVYPVAIATERLRLPSEQRFVARKVENLVGIYSASTQERDALGFVGRLLVQATFPHSAPRRNEWTRTNGNLKLHMLAPSEIGLPYGTYPRLLMVWLTREACRNKATKNPDEARRVFLGNSLSAFMGELGLVPSGGQWGTIHRLHDQMERLFSAVIYFRRITDGEDGFETRRSVQQTVSDNYELWWDNRHPSQGALFNSSVTLSQKFFTLITDRPVPIDMDILRHVKRSPMAIDIYWWATYRASYLRRTVTIPWASMMLQLGAGYPNTAQGRRDFRKRFKRALALVQMAWPDLRAQAKPHGLVLKPCPPSVKRLR